MLIAGIDKTTLVDYPGKVATIIFTAGCNLRCSFCHNPQTVLPEIIEQNKSTYIPEGAFFNFLNKRKNVLDGVVISGGEPTLQNNLKEFIKKIKEFDLDVKLDTNGRDFEKMKDLFESNLLDYVAIDIKTTFDNYPNLTNVKDDIFIENLKKSIDYLINSNFDYCFRTTLIKGYHKENDIKRIAKYIKGAKQYYLQNYRDNVTLDPNFDGQSFSSKELEELKEIAQKFVKTDII